MLVVAGGDRLELEAERAVLEVEETPEDLLELLVLMARQTLEVAAAAGVVKLAQQLTATEAAEVPELLLLHIQTLTLHQHLLVVV
jgi:hypothetical protein